MSSSCDKKTFKVMQYRSAIRENVVFVVRHVIHAFGNRVSMLSALLECCVSAEFLSEFNRAGWLHAVNWVTAALNTSSFSAASLLHQRKAS